MEASTVADDVDAAEVSGAVVGAWCSGVPGVTAWEPTVAGVSACPGDVVGTTEAAGAVAAACCSGWSVAGPDARVAAAGAVVAAPRSVSMPPEPEVVCEAVSGLAAARVPGRGAVAVVVSSGCCDPLLPWPSPLVIALRAGVSVDAVGVLRPAVPAPPSRVSGMVAGGAVEVAARVSCVVCARSVSGAWVPAASGACALPDTGASPPGSVRVGCDAVDGASADCRSP
ncbi:hypothetical protein [Streptomyces nigrescens]|uniref:hypothetical protein n=1 Tax=Streptomyces nigrescens TaxID=1920 RepID=UPI0021C4ABA9|nr:hypothetical protein [Streptomyces nigrescens]